MFVFAEGVVCIHLYMFWVPYWYVDYKHSLSALLQALITHAGGPSDPHVGLAAKNNSISCYLGIL